MRHRTLPKETMAKIKQSAHDRIIAQRNGDALLDARSRAAKEKQLKFCNFIQHLHEKAGLRRWKEQVFGVNDPRIALLLIEQRDKLRRDLYKPVIQQRKSLKFKKVELRERNNRIAQTMRYSLKHPTMII